MTTQSSETAATPAEPRQLPAAPKPRRAIKATEVLVIAAFVIIVGVLLNLLFSKLTLRRDTAHARLVSDKVIADVQARNGSAVWALGTSKFQKTYSAAGLTQGFKHITIATLKAPKLDQETMVNTSSGHTVFFIYKYTALKVPYYISTAITDKSGRWQLTAITGNIDESQLLPE